MKNTSPISNRELVFYRRLRRNLVFSEILAYFATVAEKEGLTKRELALRLDKQPSQITRWFSEPANLCLDTVSDLLVAMGGEMEFKIVPAEEERSTDKLMEDFADWSRKEGPASLFPDDASFGAKTNNPATIHWSWSGENGEQSAATG